MNPAGSEGKIVQRTAQTGQTLLKDLGISPKTNTEMFGTFKKASRDHRDIIMFPQMSSQAVPVRS